MIAACIACRGGQCVAHSVKRVVVSSAPVVADEDMQLVGCCDRFETDLKRRRVVKVWRFCPWCGAARA